MDEKKKILEEIDRFNPKLSVARNKLLTETIGDAEYLEIKKACKDQIESLEERLSKDGWSTQKVNIDKSLDKALQNIVNIPKLYREGGITTKRAVIGSIFPEKLEFDGKMYRTARMNVVANRIFQMNNELPQNKNRKNDSKNQFSCLVAPARIELASKV